MTAITFASSGFPRADEGDTRATNPRISGSRVSVISRSEPVRSVGVAAGTLSEVLFKMYGVVCVSVEDHWLHAFPTESVPVRTDGSSPQELLNWEVDLVLKPARKRGNVTATLKYAGRVKPIPVEDPWAD